MHSTNSSARTEFFAAVLFALFFCASATAQEQPPVSAKANPLRLNRGGAGKVSITFSVKPGFHVYGNSLSLTVPEVEGLTFGKPEMPAGEKKFDKVFKKEVVIHKGEGEILLPVTVANDAKLGEHVVQAALGYQACSEKTCFLPAEISVPIRITVTAEAASVTGGAKEEQPAAARTQPETGWAKTLREEGVLAALLIAFVAGVGLSFTPCVYPMVPITLAVIGAGAGNKPLRGFFLSLIYVLGISVTYAALGVAAATSGKLFGWASQSPWVNGALALIFFLLALAMFGVYELRPPAFIANRLGSKKWGGVAGVFAMGLAAGVVISPCISPVLATALAYIATTGNRLLGLLTLASLAWGIGVIFIVLGTFSGLLNVLPKSGAWMVSIRKFYGVIMIGAVLYFLRNIIPHTALVLTTGFLLIAFSVFAGGFEPLSAESTTLDRIRKVLAICALIFGVYFIGGTLITRGFLLPPLRVNGTATPSAAEKIRWMDSEEEGIVLARQSGKPVMIDFRADWCAACLELERETFSDARVASELRRFVAIKVDCTDTNDPRVKDMQRKYGVVGLPTLIFIDSAGKVLSDKTVNEYIPPERLLAILREIK